jgi:carbon monoxide dehydrogenase subunit G
MQLQQQQTILQSQADLWQALNDIRILQSCIPGCESLVPTGVNEFEVLMLVAIGPVKTRFKGKLRLADLVPPTSYTLHFEGQGGGAGHGKGSAQVRLEPAGPTKTVLHYTANATVGGRIAQVGSRLVDMAAQKLAAEFFAAFDKQLQTATAGDRDSLVASEPEPTRSWFMRLREWLLKSGKS